MYAASVVGCAGPQSALDPAGRDAERLANLFWGMTAGAAAIWVLVIGLTVYASRFARHPHDARGAKLLIVGGGVVFPTIVLAGLLVYGLAILPALLAPAPEGSLKVLVTGQQWWWRVRYFPRGESPVDLANEIRLPLGEPAEFLLESPDVIHSFWIPPLGGKVDMIPGRRTRLRLEASKLGTFRGVCAEYCGTSHALMMFPVVVETPEAFQGWLARQARPAVLPSDPVAAKGLQVFLSSGCGACHTIRGTAADGIVGPDLTHVGSRLSVGAGVLPIGVEALRRFIARTDELKPAVHMPAFGMLPAPDLNALAVYLKGLE